MLKTTNYQMNKPELTDSPPDITVLNENFDIIDEKLFSIIKAWEDFKSSGRDIGGNITVNDRVYTKYITSLEKFLRLFSSDNEGLIVDTISNRIIPSVTNVFDLGNANYRFKDIYVGAYTMASSGYTKLLNGLILQWGDSSISGTSGSQIVLPIQYSNAYRVVTTPVDSSLGTTPITSWVTAKNKANFWVRTTSTCGVQWIAIGY